MAPDLEKLKKLKNEFEIDIRSILTSAARVGVSLRDLINEYSQIKEEFGKPNYFVAFAGLSIQDHSACFHELMKFKHVCFFDGNSKRFFVQANDEKTKHLLELVLNTNIRNRAVPRGCFGPPASRASGLLSKDQMESFYAKKDEERRQNRGSFDRSKSVHGDRTQGGINRSNSLQNNGQKLLNSQIQRPTALPNDRIQSFREQNFQQLEELAQGNTKTANFQLKNVGPRFSQNDKENKKPNVGPRFSDPNPKKINENDFKNPMAVETLKTVFERLGVRQRESIKKDSATPNNYSQPSCNF